MQPTCNNETSIFRIFDYFQAKYGINNNYPFEKKKKKPDTESIKNQISF